ncbi:MAG: type VI secretion system protein VasD [Paraglaciecola psychrophila]
MPIKNSKDNPMTNGSATTRLLLSLILSCVVLSGCQASRGVLNLATTASLNFSAEVNINPDDDDRASPLVISIFKLTDSRLFLQSNFLDLYEQPEQQLGASLVGHTRLEPIAPGSQRVEQFELTDDIKFLGVIGEFTQYQQAKSILVLPITGNKSNSFDLSIKRLEMHLVAD